MVGVYRHGCRRGKKTGQENRGQENEEPLGLLAIVLTFIIFLSLIFLSAADEKKIERLCEAARSFRELPLDGFVLGFLKGDQIDQPVAIKDEGK